MLRQKKKKQAESRGIRGGRFKRPRSIWEWLTRALLLFQVALVLAISAAVGVGIGAFVTISKTLPTNPKISEIVPKAVTKVYASSGELLGKVWDENRELAPIAEIPQKLQLAVIAVEDKRFYQHHGVDPIGILRALKANLSQWRMVQGASTITQQLARTLYLSRKRTWGRKLQEAILALEIERRHSKEEILELYLNQVCFGHGAYGIKSAAQLYFGKDLKDLTLAECALLAALPRRPVYYSPYNKPKVALARRNYVLRRMHRRGYIKKEQLEKAQKEPITLAGKKPVLGEEFRAPYFTSFVVQQLIKRYGHDLVYTGGLRVYTTLQMPVQEEAEKAIQRGIERLKRRRASQAALVAIDPNTGYIVAMVGGIDYKKSQFNRATQALRQPGSSFKIFTYTTAIAQGLSPSSQIDARQHTYGRWKPRNANNKTYETVSLKAGLVHSINTAAANLQQRVGTKNIIQTAKAMGIDSDLRAVPSLTLGTSEVTLLDMTEAMQVFPTEGIRHQPLSITRVEDHKGHVLDRFKPRAIQAIEAKTARTMKGLLKAVITSGTGWRARGAYKEAGGKTGTAQDYRDVWFVGFTPQLVAGVWAGNDDHSPTARLFGGSACAPIWKDFMKTALKIYKPPSYASTTPPKPAEPEYEPPPKTLEETITPPEPETASSPQKSSPSAKESTKTTTKAIKAKAVAPLVRPQPTKEKSSHTKGKKASPTKGSGLKRGSSNLPTPTIEHKIPPQDVRILR